MLGFGYQLPQRSLSEIKSICNILFIDDRRFEVVDILKKAGWENTRRLNDIESLDSKEIVESHIIFVDIQGFGKKLGFGDEGLGLILALKEKYPEKKVIVYSAEVAGDRFHEALSAADARLKKNADPYQFQSYVEKFAKEIFSFSEVVARIQICINKETGIRLSEKEIIKGLKKIGKRGVVEDSIVAKIFNLQNAAAISSIIQLFLSVGK